MKAGNIATLNNTGRNFKIIGVTNCQYGKKYLVREITFNVVTGVVAVTGPAVHYYEQQLRKVLECSSIK